MNDLIKENSVKGSLSLEEFESLYKILVKRAAKDMENNLIHWLVEVQSFLEFFWISILDLSEDDLELFEYKKDIKSALQNISMQCACESIVFVASNMALMDHKVGLSIDAYKTALEIYERECKDPRSIKDKVIKVFEGRELDFYEKIINSIPDEIYAKKMMSIQMTFKGLNKAEKKYITHSLCTKKGLDDSIVINLEDLHKKYLKEQGDIK